MPPPALMTSAPPTPSMMSLPEPPVMTLVPVVPPIVIPVDQRRRIDVLEVRDRRGIAGGLVGVGQVDRRGRSQDQGIVAGAAVDRDFGIVVGDRIVAGSGVDDIGAAAAIDDIVAGTRRNRVGRRRTRDRQRGRNHRGIQVLEIGDGDRVAGGLVDAGRDGKIDRRDAARRRERQRVGSGAAIDRRFRALVDDLIVAAAGVDDVSAARAVDRIVARAAGDRIGACRTW